MSFSDMFTYPPFAFFALACVTFVFRCGFRPAVKAVWVACLLLAFSKFWCFKIFWGSLFNPEIPDYLLIVWDTLFVGAFILSLVSPLFLSEKRNQKKRRSRLEGNALS